MVRYTASTELHSGTKAHRARVGYVAYYAHPKVIIHSLDYSYMPDSLPFG